MGAKGPPTHQNPDTGLYPIFNRMATQDQCYLTPRLSIAWSYGWVTLGRCLTSSRSSSPFHASFFGHCTIERRISLHMTLQNSLQLNCGTVKAVMARQHSHQISTGQTNLLPYTQVSFMKQKRKREKKGGEKKKKGGQKKKKKNIARGSLQ